MIINEHKICEGNEKPTIIFFRSIDHQAGHGTWLSKIFPMFCNNNFTIRLKSMCPEIVANVQPGYVNVLQLWPSCIITEYSRYFRDNVCSEFDLNATF
ncbi:uncharacterized protein LOC103575872 [Microplitis demolitor]|uniref:uncharacterized protein LOC103575872 n=1 Tax=Microplitis demolitor TaxID=69319 RepID=UPI00235B6A25|nr:uncharacterized protein LOC103575872 [Microplitis demolitor]